MSTIATTSQPVTSSPLRRLISGHPLVAYFFIAFTGTWLTILPILLGRDGVGLFPYRFGAAGVLVALLGTFTGPLLASYVVTALTSGKAGMRALLRRYVQWRVGVQWYFAALFAGLLIWLAGFSILLNGEPLFALIAHPSLLLSVYLISLPLLIVFSFGEETGWRGFALPRLQQRYGPLRGTVLRRCTDSLILCFFLQKESDVMTLTNQVLQGQPSSSHIRLQDLSEIEVMASTMCFRSNKPILASPCTVAARHHEASLISCSSTILLAFSLMLSARDDASVTEWTVYSAILVVPPLRSFFELKLLGVLDYIAIGVLAILWGLLLHLAWRMRLLERFLGVE